MAGWQERRGMAVRFVFRKGKASYRAVVQERSYRDEYGGIIDDWFWRVHTREELLGLFWMHVDMGSARTKVAAKRAADAAIRKDIRFVNRSLAKSRR